MVQVCSSHLNISYRRQGSARSKMWFWYVLIGNHALKMHWYAAEASACIDQSLNDPLLRFIGAFFPRRKIVASLFPVFSQISCVLCLSLALCPLIHGFFFFLQGTFLPSHIHMDEDIWSILIAMMSCMYWKIRACKGIRSAKFPTWSKHLHIQWMEEI